MQYSYQEKVNTVCKNLQLKTESVDNKMTVRHAYIKELASVMPCLHDISPDLVERLRNEYAMIKDDYGLTFFRGEKELFCMYLANELQKRTGDFSFDYFIHDRVNKPVRICYVKNHFSDIAYRIFDNALGRITSEYADSFELAAQSVFYENSNGCILPYESEGGGIMPGIRLIAEKYELNKSYVCMVDTGGQMTKFVLFTRGIWIDKQANKIEFTVNTENFFQCSDIISACHLFGFDDGHVVSNSFGEEYGRNSTFIFSGDKDKMTAIMLYLALEYGRSNISGIYREIK